MGSISVEWGIYSHRYEDIEAVLCRDVRLERETSVRAHRSPLSV